MSGSAFAVTHHAFSSGAGRTSDGNGSHASTLKSPSYTKSVSWQHYRVRISIDDFGTGLSNLKRFYEINPDSIKVDSQFTGDIFGTAGKIVRIIFDLARYNRIPVIAEGVESEDVARELIKLGCVQAQGYLYQKPMPFSAWDKSGKLVKE
ncbi:EAL domain-containing protein [Escherichia coli]|uniref:EAL domain-containing protein n=1 Tax=Escherichia coli TaxID=562 RepID=UPI003EC6F70D